MCLLCEQRRGLGIVDKRRQVKEMQGKEALRGTWLRRVSSVEEGGHLRQPGSNHPPHCFGMPISSGNLP